MEPITGQLLFDFDAREIEKLRSFPVTAPDTPRAAQKKKEERDRLAEILGRTDAVGLTLRELGLEIVAEHLSGPAPRLAGGDRAMVPYIARAAIAAGVAAVFAETHQDPDNAPSDGPCMVRLDDMEGLLQQLKEIDAIVKR